MLFLPQLLLSIFSTLNFRSLSSLKILYRQPSLILLPIVTYFTFSRDNIGCCGGNNRVSFSKKFTCLNVVASFVGYFGWGVWWYGKSVGRFFWFFLIILPLLGLSIIPTSFFLCCQSIDPMEEYSVYDPELDKRFIMKDGELVDPKDSE